MASQSGSVFDPTLPRKKVTKSKILVIGVGDLGCELLKWLVTSGFSDIEIVSAIIINIKIVIFQAFLSSQIDLDMTDKDRSEKSRAKMASESALTLNPKVQIKTYNDSITT